MENVKTPEGIVISFERSGSGPPLVMLHGSLNNHQTAWMMVKPLLEAQFTVYAVDRRGRGETTATEGHTIADEANDALAVIESIGEPVLLLGHSFGAHVALAAAAKAPEKIRKLMLYEPPRPTAMSRELLTRLQGLAASGQDEAMVEDFLLNGPRVPAEEVAMIRATPFWQFLVGDAQNSIREWPALTDLEFDAQAFSTLNVPVLLIAGDQSPDDVYETTPLAGALPNARVAVLQGQAHLAQAMAPQVFADTVTAFAKEGVAAE